MNRVLLKGHVDRTPVLKQTSDGARTRFRLTVPYDLAIASRVSGSEIERFSIMATDALAEVCANSLRKGDEIYAIGSLYHRRYTNVRGSLGKEKDVVLWHMSIISSKEVLTQLEFPWDFSSEDEDRPKDSVM